MNEKRIKYLIQLLLFLSIGIGGCAMLSFMEVNRIRADEFLSFLHSNPQSHFTIAEIWQNIASGADNSYTHAILLFKAFQVFGGSIIAQRMVSFVFWLSGGIIVWFILKQQNKSNTHCFLFLTLIQFSNIGFMLANDGRFYSMVYMLSLLIFLSAGTILQSRRRIITSVLLAVLALIAMLTSSVSIVFFVLLVIALLLLFIRKMIDKTALMNISIPLALALVLYFSIFKITPLHSHFSTWLFSPSTSDALLINDLASTPFRFIAVISIPGLPDSLNAVISLLLFCGILYYSHHIKPITNSNSFYLLNELFLLLIMLFIGQLCVYLISGWPIWPYRYYAGLFWILPLWLSQYVHLELRPVSMLAIMMSSGLVVSMCIQLTKIKSRKAENQPVETQKRMVFIEEFEKYKTLGKMGDTYMRFPQTRNRIFLGLDSNSTERNNYINSIKAQGDDLPTISQTEIELGDLIILGDSVQYPMWLQKGHEVVVLK